jgi:hypothetical protein
MDALKKDSQSDEEEKKDDDSPAKALAEAYRQDPQYNYLKQLALETPIKFRHMVNHVSRQSTGLLCAALDFEDSESPGNHSLPRKLTRRE